MWKRGRREARLVGSLDAERSRSVPLTATSAVQHLVTNQGVHLIAVESSHSQVTIGLHTHVTVCWVDQWRTLNCYARTGLVYHLPNVVFCAPQCLVRFAARKTLSFWTPVVVQHNVNIQCEPNERSRTRDYMTVGKLRFKTANSANESA